jgi:hypothetical protein
MLQSSCSPHHVVITRLFSGKVLTFKGLRASWVPYALLLYDFWMCWLPPEGTQT